jgi:hypothetical protein
MGHGGNFPARKLDPGVGSVTQSTGSAGLKGEAE